MPDLIFQRKGGYGLKKNKKLENAKRDIHVKKTIGKQTHNN